MLKPVPIAIVVTALVCALAFAGIMHDVERHHAADVTCLTQERNTLELQARGLQHLVDELQQKLESTRGELTKLQDRVLNEYEKDRAMWLADFANYQTQSELSRKLLIKKKD